MHRIGIVESLPLTIPRRETFRIARGASDVAEVVLVAVHAGPYTGHGCAAPSEVTGESVPTVLDSLQRFSRVLSQLEFESPREVADRLDRTVPGHPAAKAAIDMALYDIVAQAAGQPLYAYLGGTKDRMATDMTIGIMDAEAAVDRAKRWVSLGFRALKVKVGHDWKSDLDRLRAIRRAVGPSIELRIDGNQGYRWGDALSLARGATDVRVSLFEQPVSATDWEGMRVLSESSPIPIMADEMILTPDDAKKARWGNAARAVNLKLMKHGGIARATDVNTICESAGYPTMVGCMGEPQLSIAAGLHFALAQKNVRWVDLDSHFNLVDDPTSGLAFEVGELVAPSRPGLGIDVRFPEMS